MSVVTYARDHAARVFDTLQNFVSGLGTAKDPRTSSHFQFRELDRVQIEAAYRSDWMARRLVDLPAEDATREWRAWQADPKKIEAIEGLEKKLFLRQKTRQAITRARLYGGAALVLGVDQGQPEEELDLDRVGRDDLRFVVVLNRYELSAGPRVYNVDSPYFTRPEYYAVSTPMFGFTGQPGMAYPTNGGGGNTALSNLGRDPAGRFGASPPPRDYGKPGGRPGYAKTPDGDFNKQWIEKDYGLVQIHPSRVIEFTGNELPDWRLSTMGGGWGDSVLQTIDDALRDFAMIVSGLASLINDMKMDVVKIPELSRKLSTSELTQKTLERFSLANQAKSTINTLLLDKDEEWQRIQTSFGSTPELIKVAMTLACAAGGVPESRIMGNSPNKGLAAQGASGGEIDVRNYYDDISSQQNTKYRPLLSPLDICLQRSALGSYDPMIDYSWNPLYQPDPSQVAQVNLQKAQTTQVYASMGLFNEDLLRDSVSSQISEDEVYPGWDDAVDEHGLEPEEPPAPPPEMLPTPPPGMVNKGHFEANPFQMLRAQQAAKTGQPIRVPPHPSNRPPIKAPAPPQPKKAKDGLSDYSPDQPRDEVGRWTEGGGAAGGGAGGAAVGVAGAAGGNGAGAGGSGGTGNYGLVPGDVAKFHQLKAQWSVVNNQLLAQIDHPDSSEAQASLDQLETIVKQMHGLRADPGTAEGIGLPGGPRDVTIVGAGPGGLAAGIFGGAEGLDTLVVEANAVAGGQAKFSSRIENFPGFPIGVTGEKLTSDMFEQAERVGAETKLGSRVTGLTYDAETGLKHLTLSNGETIDTRAVILAGGVEFRKPDFPGADGPGVIVGDGKKLTQAAAGGEAVVVGGSNGAAQAALGAATKATHVTLLSRSPLSKSMSDYQIGALHNNAKVTVMEGEGVAGVERDASGNLQGVKTVTGKTLSAKALGMFLGSAPETDWLASAGVGRDKAGRIETNHELETKIPGVFAVGDMRVGAIGRVGVAVGEGQLALRQSHVYLDSLKQKAGIKAGDALIEDDDSGRALISRLFDLDRANPWFGQTLEGVKPGRRTVQDYSPDQPRDDKGQWTSGGGAFVSGSATALGHGEVAMTGSAYAAARVAAKASHDFFTSEPVRRGIAAAVAGAALSTTASVAHETTMHLLKQGTEIALDGAVTMVGSHLLGHAGLVAAGGVASSIAPVAIAVVAGVAVHKLAEYAGITDENAKHVLAKAGRFLVDHYHAFAAAAERTGPSGSAVDAEADDDMVLQALRLLVPYWEVGPANSDELGEPA